MAKENKFKSSLENLGNKITSNIPNTPIQTAVEVKPTVHKVEETRFTVHIPTPLMNVIKDIGHENRKKIKTIFVEALEEYVYQSQLNLKK
ncbi:hypothetical protein [Lacihabitans lacunae]|uniref:CopG family transcriptional regulator n=1 Tax=Lacihabitans lacunae TaxID=1028214 RepID=A0ABV7Z4Q2_9BACT